MLTKPLWASSEVVPDLLKIQTATLCGLLNIFIIFHQSWLGFTTQPWNHKVVQWFGLLHHTLAIKIDTTGCQLLRLLSLRALSSLNASHSFDQSRFKLS